MSHIKTHFPGLTIYACFGRYAGFKLYSDIYTTRVILGWVSLAVMRLDLECLLVGVSKALPEPLSVSVSGDRRDRE